MPNAKHLGLLGYMMALSHYISADFPKTEREKRDIKQARADNARKHNERNGCKTWLFDDGKVEIQARNYENALRKYNNLKK